MDNRKALANSFYALAASMSLVAGMTALSITDPAQEVETPGSIGSPEIPGNISLPGNSSLPDSNTSTPAGNISVPQNVTVREDGLIAGIARGIFEALSGQKLKPPDTNLSIGNVSAGNISTGNQTSTPSGGNNTGPEGNITEPPELNGTPPELNGSIPEGSGDQGFLSGMLKQLSQMFNFSASPDQGLNSSQNPEEDPRNPDEPERPDQPDNPDESGKPDDSQESSQQNPGLPELPDNLLLLVAGVLLVAVVFLGHRSDVDMKALLRAMAVKAKDFVVSIPDLFRRTVVRIAMGITGIIRRMTEIIAGLARTPVRTLEKILDAWRNRARLFRDKTSEIKERGMSSTIKSMLPGASTPEEGLAKIWFMLRKAAGLQKERSLTPAEIGERARDQGVDPATVEEVVEAYRWEKYAPEGFDGKLKLDEWERNLGGDDG